jgi:lactoylglutathione lyase
MKTILASLILLATSACATVAGDDTHHQKQPNMSNRPTIGAFSVSLAVKDLAASRAFYEKLGFEVTGGNQQQNWLVLRNADATVGLFQGMFENNIMTFNPGWNRQAQPLDEFEDVRVLQKRFKAAGLQLQTEADESTTGPASFVLLDPDGNAILVDQHVQ